MYLPKSPSNEQKALFVDSGKTEFYIFSSISTIILLAGSFLFIKNYYYLIPYTIFCLVNLTYLICAYLVGFMSRDFDYIKHDALVTKHLDRSSREEIDILLPVCGESISIIRNTWVHVEKLVQAHEGIIKVWVLDDKRDLMVASLADQFQFNYITRPNNHLKKAGNLRNIFPKTTAPYFIILDADFSVRTDFIINLMPYFYEDEKVGMSQCPQFFEASPMQTKVERAAGVVQELFYRLIQVNRDHFDGAISVGSNCIYSRKHLEPYGGTADVAFSEDVRSAYRLSKDGGKVKYIPVNLAMGVCPETWKSFFTQYYRWSMGSLDLMLSKEFWQKGLTKMQRVCYMTGMLYYLTTGLSVLFISMPSIYLLLFNPDFIFWFNLIFSIPSLLLSTVFMRYWSKLPYDLDVLRVRHVSFYAHLYALKDLIMHTTEAWIPSGTNTSSKKYDSFCIFYTFMTIAVPIVTFGLIMTRIEQGYDWQNFVLLAAITTFNAYIAIPVIDDL